MKPVNDNIPEADNQNTRERILLTAIRLFAEKGVDAVSLRTINQQAGAKNASATHYHFGNKYGLVEAIFKFIQEQLQPLFDQQIHLVAQQLQAGSLTVRSLVEASFRPFLVLYLTPGYGKDALRFFSRIQLETSRETRALITTYLGKNLAQSEQLLQQLLPQKEPRVLRTQFLHCTSNVVNGLANIELLKDSPLGDCSWENLEELAGHILDFAAAGLASETTELIKIQKEPS